MKASSIVLQIALLLSTAFAFDCNSNDIKGIDFESIKGLHHVSVIEDTFPSVSNLTWFINVCGPINDGEHKEFESLLKECPKDSQICGIKYISLPGAEPLKTEVISFSNSLTPKFDVDEKAKKVMIKLEGATWGAKTISGDLSFVCDKDAKSDDNIKIETWNNHKLEIVWPSNAMCSKSSNGGKHDDKNDGDNGDKPPEKSQSSFGIFSLVINLICVVISIYLVGITWIKFNNNERSIQEAASDVTEMLRNVGSAAPGFFKEVVEKIFGSGSRGGYSAV